MTDEPTTTSMAARSIPLRVALWFVSGALAVLVFHQGALAILHGLGIAPFAPLPMAPTEPFGVPQLISLMFWGGVWGLLLALVVSRLSRGAAYWVVVAGFGAIGPTLVAAVVVLPLKGIAPGGDAPAAALISALLINAAWGVGTALFRDWGARLLARSR